MPQRIATTKWRWIVCGAAAAALAALVAGSVVAASAATPVNTTEPSVTGSPIVGKILTGDRGTWTGSGITYTYKWLRCDNSNCNPISGETDTKYTLVSADLGTAIVFEVTAKNVDGTKAARSKPTANITTSDGIPANAVPPTIAGSASVGTTLTATTGTWVGDTPITYSYQWQKCDKAGNACKNISNANNSTYKVASSLIGSTVRIRVTGKNARGKSTAISEQTAVVQDATGGGGIINLPGGGKSIDVTDVPKGERLIVNTVTFSPNPVTSRNSPITVTITVKDTRGYFVRNAYVFIRSTPILTSTPTDQQTATDGRIAYSIAPRSDFPLKTGYSVQFFVKAYRKGDPSLAGISGTRLVQVATAS